MQIDGLTPHQKNLAETMWNIQSIDDLDYWMNTLPENDALMCLSIMKIMLFEKIEEDLIELESYPQATEALGKFML
jgi:hypothetical protein